MAHALCAVARCVVDTAGHSHGPGCGHASFEHNGHVDYLVSGSAALQEPAARRRIRRHPPTQIYRHPSAFLPCQVGDELHHVRDSCCVNDCHGGPVVVSHGRLSTLLHRCGEWRVGLAAHFWAEQSRMCSALHMYSALSDLFFCCRRRGAADPTEPLATPLLRPAPAAAAAADGGRGCTAASLEVEPAPAGGAGEPQPRTTRIYAAGICCPMEVPLVHSVLDGLPGVEQVGSSRKLFHSGCRESNAALVGSWLRSRVGLYWDG